jgi:hypothetical protein
MSLSTVSRRALAAAGDRYGSYRTGLCTSPASSAASGIVSLTAGFPKYVRDAFSTPYALEPK